jgi:hypothetical protein
MTRTEPALLQLGLPARAVANAIYASKRSPAGSRPRDIVALTQRIFWPNAGKEGKWPVSVKGGTRPIWSRDGRELFYIAADNKLMAVDVKSGARFEHGVSKPLF